jgi:hypothetical protein
MNKEDIIPNQIYTTTNLEVLIEVVRKTENIKNSDLLEEDFTVLLADYIFTKRGMVLVSYGDDKEMNACFVVSRQRDKRGDFLWIDFAWVSSKYPNLHKKYYEEIMGTCKVKGISRVQMRMRKGFKAMSKLYGVYEIGRILEGKV